MTQPLIGITCQTLSAMLPKTGISRSYVDAIADAGGAPVLIPIGLDERTLRRIYGLLDGLLLPGGEDIAPGEYGHDPHPNLGFVDPARDELELTLARWALGDDLPTLGICRGIQLLAVAAGGSLYQDLPSEWESGMSHNVGEYGRDHLSHELEIEPGSLLCSAVGCTATRVNSFHHQAVRDLPSGFVISARSPDGVIEGIEAPGKQFVLGIQCHPENIWATSAREYRGLFAAFVEAARVRSKVPA